jgi:hypothetical protein
LPLKGINNYKHLFISIKEKLDHLQNNKLKDLDLKDLTSQKTLPNSLKKHKNQYLLIKLCYNFQLKN